MAKSANQTIKKKCTYCGNEIPNSNTNYCLNCGTDKYNLEVKAIKDASTSSRNTYVAFIFEILALITSILAVITAIHSIGYFLVAIFSIFASVIFIVVGALFNRIDYDKDKTKASLQNYNFILLVLSSIFILISVMLIMIY